jgi:hypothetical protein
MTESQLQQTCVRWFRYQFSFAAPFLIAVPNGAFLQGNKKQRSMRWNKLSAEGALAGVADLILFDPLARQLPLFIEMKKPDGRQSEWQLLFERTYTQAGYTYKVCRSFEEFEHAVTEYLTKDA